MFIVRSGDVEKFIMLEIMQLLLRRQVEDLTALLELPPSFQSTVRAIWFTYVSSLSITYSEEVIDEPTPSEVSSRKSSVTSLNLESASEPDFFDFSEDDLDMSSTAPAEHVTKPPAIATQLEPTDRLKGKGKPHLPLTLVILALGLMYHKVPVFIADLHRLALQGRLFYFRVYELITKDISRHLLQQQKASFRNITVPYLPKLGVQVIALARLMQRSNSVPLPVLDCRIVFWRIGEELCLPYLFREDLAALSVRFSYDFTFGLVQERLPSDPLITAFALTIFFLKVHYSLLDSALKHSEQRRFSDSGFPTMYQLIESWKRRYQYLINPHGYDEEELRDDLEFYKTSVIPFRNSKDTGISAEDIAQLRRALQLQESSPANQEASEPTWLKSDPDKEIEITDIWAKKYATGSGSHPFSEFSEGYRLLVEIGARLCACHESRIGAVVERLFETTHGYGIIRGFFAMKS